MPATSRVDVDLTAVAANVRIVRQALSARTARLAGGRVDLENPVGICAVLKADGYSLGAARIAKRLGLSGVELLAVYTPEQARGLIEANITSPILLLMPVYEMDRSDALYRAASRGQLHFTIHDEPTFRALAAISDKMGLHLAVQLEIDTGMSRGGASPDEATAVLKKIIAHPRMRLTGVFNHFASADTSDDFTAQQAAEFSRWLEHSRAMIPRDCMVHEANTYGTFRASAYHRTMVRVGLALLGFAQEDFRDPEAFELVEEAAQLHPAVRWISQLVQIKKIEPGTPVGYQSTWRAQRPSRIGLIPVGYADGYPRACGNTAKVGVTLASGLKAFVPVVGRVSMDQITVDLTDIPESEVALGATVEIIGSDRTAPNHLPTVAQHGGTIAHELLCRISPRLPRHYIAVEQPQAREPVAAAVAV